MVFSLHLLILLVKLQEASWENDWLPELGFTEEFSALILLLKFKGFKTYMFYFDQDHNFEILDKILIIKIETSDWYLRRLNMFREVKWSTANSKNYSCSIYINFLNTVMTGKDLFWLWLWFESANSLVLINTKIWKINLTISKNHSESS